MRFALLLTAFFLSAQGLPIPQDSGMVESPPLVHDSDTQSMAESGQVSALPVSGSESGEAAPESEAPASEAPASENEAPQSPESSPEESATESP